LTRLQPQKIVTLGGTGVVSAVDAAALASFTARPVERLAGANRFATAAAISVWKFSPGAPVVYIATGGNFPDALAGGPVAGINAGPVLLLNRDSIPGATAAELARLAPKEIVILGGPGVVSTKVENQLAAFIN
jgi:putative cell wall-binding protein